MNSKPKISVIMPSLNVRKYIEVCMDSVRGQTLKDLEILCVDAGSDDGTREYLDSVAKGDTRIRVITSEKRSYGYQVNLGLSEAKGEYITILDTDDYLTPDIYEELYSVASGDPELDYVKGTVEYFYSFPGGEYTYLLRQLPESYYKNGRAVIKPCMHPELLQGDGFVWTGIYRADYIKQFRLHESPGAAYQDLGIVLQVQLNGKKAVFLDKVCYHYRQDNMGASGYSPKGVTYTLNEYRWARNLVNGADEKWKRAFARKYFMHFLFVMDNMARFGVFREEVYDDLLEIRNDMMEFIKLGWLDPKDLWEDLKEDVLLLMKDPKSLYDKHMNRFNAHMKLVREAEKRVEGKDVVIAGCGKIGRNLLDRALFHQSCKVKALADNSISIIGTTIRSLQVYSVDEAASLFPDATFLIASRNGYRELVAQLYAKGISDDRIVVCTESYQDIASFAFR